jgi:hypothetical protein
MTDWADEIAREIGTKLLKGRNLINGPGIRVPVEPDIAAALRKARQDAESALKPFADLFDAFPDYMKDDPRYDTEVHYEIGHAKLTFGHFRAAHRALKEKHHEY